MKNVQKPDHVILKTLINRLREGRYVIPDFQREFEWQPSDIRELMRSIFLDYYIGSLLLWRGKSSTFDALACEPIYGFEETKNGTDRTYIVLDGQQRLTAMYYAFLAPDEPAPRRRNRFLYFIQVDRFAEEDYEQAFKYDWTRRGVNLLNNRNAQFESHMFPLAVMGQGGWNLGNWVQDYEQYWRTKEEKAKSAGDQSKVQMASQHVANADLFGKHLEAITEQYQVVYIELDEDLEIEKVCDIFTQVNSRGIRLDVFDLINALLKPKGIQLKHLWRAAAPRLDFIGTGRMNVYILQVMSILRQAYCSPKYLYFLLPGQEKTVRDADGSFRKEVLVNDVAEFQREWEEAVDALSRAIELLRHPQEFGAISSRYLPYVSILPAFAAISTSIRFLPASRQLDANRKLRHWYWASVFTYRYSGAVESTSTRDFLDLKTWFKDNDAQPALIADFENRFRNLDLRETKRGSSVYNGVFNLLVLRGARDWMTGTVPQYGDLDDHHIIPKSWQHAAALETSINTILNRTPMTGDTNRNVIRGRLPNEYLPELIEENGEITVRAILESHFISPEAFKILMRDPFTPEDYEAFLTERQRTLKEAIEDLLVKERLDLSPQLRDLDAQVEAIELELRNQIRKILQGGDGNLPPHVLQRIQQRIKAASKKNPALDTDFYETLAGKLEYADLRELQDTVASKANWQLFQQVFASKEMLVKRFDQLAELRNGIRHSRTVDEVTRKEGEAAILWFQKAIAE